MTREEDINSFTPEQRNALRPWTEVFRLVHGRGKRPCARTFLSLCTVGLYGERLHAVPIRGKQRTRYLLSIAEYDRFNEAVQKHIGGGEAMNGRRCGDEPFDMNKIINMK